MILLADTFWHFTLQHYSRPEVQKACLQLQNQHQGNVNLALMFLWLDKQSITLDDWQPLQQALKPTDTLLSAFRPIRTQTKAHDQDLYQQMLSFELMLEQRQQVDLIDAANQQQRSVTSNPTLLKQYCHSLNAATLASEIAL